MFRSIRSAITLVIVIVIFNTWTAGRAYAWDPVAPDLTISESVGVGCSIFALLESVPGGRAQIFVRTPGGDTGFNLTDATRHEVNIPFNAGLINNQCGVTNTNLIEQSVDNPPGTNFDTATSSVLAFSATEMGGNAFVYRAQISGPVDSTPVISVTKTAFSAPPTFSKQFLGDTIASGGSSTLTFTINNTANPVTASSLAFTDNLPVGVVVSATPNASTTCTGGTLTAGAGSSTISYTGGTVNAGGVCTVDVDVTSTTVGSHVNTSGDLTSSLGNSGTATDTLTIITADPVTFTKEFTDDPALPGGTVTLEFTITNSDPTNGASVTGFSDDLDATLTGLEATSTVTNTCGGMAAGFPTTNFVYSGGSVPASSSCTIAISLDVPAAATAGDYSNTTSDLSYSVLGLSLTTPGASDTLTIDIPGATVEHTSEAIASFLGNRLLGFSNNQVNLRPFVTGNNINGGGELGMLTLNANEANQTFRFSTSRSKILASRNKAIKARMDEAFGASSSPAAQIPSDPLDPFGEFGEEVGVVANQPVEQSNYGFDTVSVQLEETATALANNVDGTQQAEGDHIGRAGSWDIWTEIFGSLSNSGASDADLVIGYLGAHYFVDDYTLVGIMGQLDWASETNTTFGSNANGFGWMIGPYVAGKMPGQEVIYEARVAYGTSDNDISPIGTYTDNFDTTRFLATAKITGSYEHGMYTINPAASIGWFEETQGAYIDSIAQLIPEQTVSLGEIRFGPSITKTVTLDDGTVFTPSVGISGVYNFGISNNLASQGFAIGDGDFRARVDAGFTASNTLAGIILMITGFYDGIGTDGYDAFGGTARVTIPLN